MDYPPDELAPKRAEKRAKMISKAGAESVKLMAQKLASGAPWSELKEIMDRQRALTPELEPYRVKNGQAAKDYLEASGEQIRNNQLLLAYHHSIGKPRFMEMTPDEHHEAFKAWLAARLERIQNNP